MLRLRNFVHVIAVAMVFASQFGLYLLLKSKIGLAYNFDVFFTNNHFWFFWGALFALNALYLILDGIWKKS